MFFRDIFGFRFKVFRGLGVEFEGVKVCLELAVRCIRGWLLCFRFRGVLSRRVP